MIGSDAQADTYVEGVNGAAEIKVVGFDSNDTIDSLLWNDLTTSVNEETGAVESVMQMVSVLR